MCNTETQLNEREIFYKQQIINKYGWEVTLFCEIYDSGGGPKSNKTKQKHCAIFCKKQTNEYCF